MNLSELESQGAKTNNSRNLPRNGTSVVAPHIFSESAGEAEQLTRLNAFGYYELIDKPSEAMLAHYYATKYYQQSIRTHRPTYSPEERQYRANKIEQKLRSLTGLRETPLPRKASFLDIGAGEAFAMDFFHQKGWNVVGLDYSAHHRLPIERKAEA